MTPAYPQPPCPICGQRDLVQRVAVALVQHDLDGTTPSPCLPLPPRPAPLARIAGRRSSYHEVLRCASGPEHAAWLRKAEV
jgi:hypothetical protein